MKKNLTGVLLAFFLVCGLSTKAYSLSVGMNRQNLNHAVETEDVQKSLDVKYLTLDTVAFSAGADASGEAILIAVTEEYGYNDGEVVPPKENYRGWFGIPDPNAKAGDVIWTEKVKYKKENNRWVSDTVRVSSTVLYVGAASDDIVCAMPARPNRIYMFGAFRKGQDGLYSQTRASAAALSPITLPFIERFENVRDGDADPFLGWVGTKNFRLENGGLYGLNTPYSTMEENTTGERQEAVLALPPIEVPADSNLLFNINYTYAPGNPNTLWSSRDSVVIEVSADDGKTFEKIRVIHSQISSKVNILNDMVVTGYSGKQVLLRLRAVSYSELPWDIGIYDLKVYSVARCDLPRNVTSAPVGGDLRFDWQPSARGETEWQVGYAGILQDGLYAEWSKPLSSDRPSYELKGLEDNRLYRFRVRSVCGVGLVSGWVETEARSNRVPTFIEDFSGVTANDKDPVYWKSAGAWQDALPAVLNVNSLFMYSKGTVLYWKTDTQVQESGKGNHALAWDLNAVGYYALSGVLATPTVRINSSESPRLVFDLAYGKPVSGGKFDILTEPAKDHKLELYVSTDGGKTFATTTPLRRWNAADLAALKDSARIEIDLSEYDGLISFAFGVFGKKNAAGEGKIILYLDNFGIVNTRATASDLKVEDIGIDAATISWVGDKTVAEWLVRLYGASADTMFAVSHPKVVFSGLQPRSEYTCSVSVAYAPGDTAAWKSITFRTGGEDCEEAKDLKVAAVTQRTATLEWGGTAESYRIRIRPVSETAGEWTFYTVEGKSCTVKNLQLATQYECGIQALCSYALSDTSGYAEFDPFTTLGITCETPYSLLVVGEPTQTSAVCTWTGDAAAYQVEWSIFGNSVALGSLITEKDTCTLTGLQASHRYEFRVRSICGVGDTSFWSEETREFQTAGVQTACTEPSSLEVIGTPTHSLALVAWMGRSASYQVEWALKGSSEPLGRLIVNKVTCTLTDLQASTDYEFRVRGICSPGDTSAWSKTPCSFRTADAAECAEPYDLKVESITETSALVSWDAEGGISGFILRYGLVSADLQWDSIQHVTDYSYEFFALQPKSVYVWSVMSKCSNGLYSNWAGSSEFETDGVGNESRKSEELRIATATGRIYLMNPSSIEIDRVLLYSTEGILLENYSVRSKENVILTTSLRMKVAVVVVESEGRIFRFKTLLP